jgi:predicted enzyme related to lactoylglutathione lyase
MPHVDKHPAGEFCWIELATTDQSAANKFYSSLFGWNVNDMPMGPNDFYTIFRIDGRDAAAGCTLRPDQTERGVPPNWMIYIAVENADQSAAKAASLGGTLLAPVFDVMDAGRMAVVQDPTGAVFCLWQAKANTGIGIAGVPGTFCWADLITPDPERAKQFYSGLFGWQLTVGQNDTSDYLHIKNGDKFIGGIPHPRHQGSNSPPHWLSYFYVADVDEAAKKAQGLGGKIYGPPMNIEGAGRMAILADPQGAAFALFKDSPRQ